VIAADAPKAKAAADAILLDVYFPALLKLLKAAPRHRWEVWLYFAGTLTASQAVALIERVLKSGFAWEQDGMLYPASEREDSLHVG
jgi:hypothetical protein